MNVHTWIDNLPFTKHWISSCKKQFSLKEQDISSIEKLRCILSTITDTQKSPIHGLNDVSDYTPRYTIRQLRGDLKIVIFVTRNENENVIILNMRHFPKYYDHFWSLAYVKLKLKMGNSCFFFIIQLVNMRERETLIWSFKSPVKVRCYFKTAYFSGETVSQKKTKTWIGKAREVKPLYLPYLSFILSDLY